MDHELVEKFIEVTGESKEIAAQYLAAADGNVETAISLLFEGGNVSEHALPQPEPSVRAPILPTQEVLVPTDSLQFIPRASNNVFDRFRDFAVETQHQEEEMTRRVAGMRKPSQRKPKRLEDLFKPPWDIAFLGTFSEAREHAKSMNRWLLVDVQNPQEFACQILNRDIWPDKQIREILKDHFVLWQTSSNTSDGVRYIDFYNVTSYPYLAIIDPRTGECMRTYSNITVDGMVSDLNDMLSTHASPESIAQDPTISEKSNCTITSVNHHSLHGNSMLYNQTSCSKTSRKLETRDAISNDVEASASISSTASSNLRILSKRSRIDELELKDQELQKQMNSQSAKAEQEHDISGTSEPSLRLCLRLPSGSKETIAMSPNHTINHFLQKMNSMGFSTSDHTFSVPFPRTNIGELSPNTRLSDTILYPSNTVFITKM